MLNEGKPDIPLKPITPAPDCEYQRMEMGGVPWCISDWHPCDKQPGCGYDPRATASDIQRKRVTIEDRLEMMEG